jgi:flagellar protein FlaJ
MPINFWVIKIPFVKSICRLFPTLGENLRKANMPYSDEDFVKRTLVSSMYMAFGLVFVLFLLLSKIMSIFNLFLTLITAFPMLFLVLFFYFFQFPTVKINKIDREINKEIVFAGRFLVVEIESGVTLFDAMKNMNKSYPIVGAYFKEIVDKVSIGTALETAITESIESSPSSSLTKILWQISNSLRTGSDIAQPLKTVVETLIREQQIMVNDYGRKLNPLAMFYMLIAIIAPSLGVTMLTIISIFVGIKLNLMIMLVIAGFMGFVQFMFVAMINSIRPPVEF